MKKAAFVILGILTGFTSSMMAQETKNPYLPEIHGTILTFRISVEGKSMIRNATD